MDKIILLDNRTINKYKILGIDYDICNLIGFHCDRNRIYINVTLPKNIDQLLSLNINASEEMKRASGFRLYYNEVKEHPFEYNNKFYNKLIKRIYKYIKKGLIKLYVYDLDTNEIIQYIDKKYIHIEYKQ